MSNTLLQLDTRDDRLEIWSMLNRLPPRSRVLFVEWCCRQVAGPNGTRPTVNTLDMKPMMRAAYREDKSDEMLTNACYGDLLALTAQWNLNLLSAAIELEKMIKLPEYRRDVFSRVVAS